jgi:hypothetical protein
LWCIRWWESCFPDFSATYVMIRLTIVGIVHNDNMSGHPLASTPCTNFPRCFSSTSGWPSNMLLISWW